MGAIIKIILELIKYGPAIIQIIQAILEMLKNQGREKTVAQVVGARNFYRAKEKLENA